MTDVIPAPRPERRCDIDWLRILAVLHPWHMPLLFLLAGAATWFALGFRSGGQYVKERFTRLMVLFGMKPLRPRSS